MPDAPPAETDVDVVVVGSGFGGAVTALRLAEKGYSVLVLEAGRDFADEDFARTSWDVRNYLWAPALGCYGIQRIHRLPDVMILAGAGVGGGSLNYANTLYVPPAAFFQDPQWAAITDWSEELTPHYATASRLLGVVTNPCDGPVERVMRQAADDLGVGDTFRHTPVGVFFGEPGETVPDPYFDGAGPARTGCTQCGNCMVGCRVGAKNTLTKNYLHLARALGARIEPMRTVTRIGLLPGAGATGPYRVKHERTGPRRGRDERVVTAAQVVLAAGTWGTQTLLHAMRDAGELPEISPRLGELTRTNSEALLGATTDRVPQGVDLTRGLAITTSFHPDGDTHVENVRYGPGSDAMGLLTTLAVRGDVPLPRPVEMLRQALRRPGETLRFLPLVRQWSRRTVVGLVMQSRDNSLRVRGRRTLFGHAGLTSTQGHGEPNPSYIAAGHDAMAAIAARLAPITGRRTLVGGTWSELFDVPLTAHFLGGAPIGATPQTGVIDAYQRLWGYPGISVMDGAAISANLGVNPSLTIAAQAERAASMWPEKGEVDQRPPQGSAYRRIATAVAVAPALAAPQLRQTGATDIRRLASADRPPRR